MPASPIPADDIASQDVQRLIDDMIETMRDAQGAGIAAPQVFESVQICVLEVKNNARYPYKPPIPLTVLINPELTPLSEEQFENYEGCLSVPNLRGIVRRSAQVHLSALDRLGQRVEGDYFGFTAGTLQHEIDHLRGTLFVDRVDDPTSLTTWTEFDRFHRDPFLAKADVIKRKYHGPSS